MLQTEHHTADDNVVIKLTKEPVSTWGEHPTRTCVTRISSKIDDLLGEGKTLAAEEDGEERLEGSFEALVHDID